MKDMTILIPTHRLKIRHGNGPTKSLGGQRQHIGDLGSIAEVMVEIIRHGQRDFRAGRDRVGFKVRQGWGVGCHCDWFVFEERDGRGRPAGRGASYYVVGRYEKVSRRAGRRHKIVWPSFSEDKQKQILTFTCQPKRRISYQLRRKPTKGTRCTRPSICCYDLLLQI